MESKVIEQGGCGINDIDLRLSNKKEISISQSMSYVYVKIDNIPALIAALQSFLPKETE